jgi:hypothetical protein
MPAIDMRERRNEAIRELVVFGVRCYTSDVETVRGTVEALTKARFPFLTMKEIEYKHATSHSGGTALFHFRVHPLDIDFVRAVADELMNAHDPNFDRTRAKLQRIVEEKTSRPEPPEWKP